MKLISDWCSVIPCSLSLAPIISMWMSHVIKPEALWPKPAPFHFTAADSGRIIQCINGCFRHVPYPVMVLPLCLATVSHYRSSTQLCLSLFEHAECLPPKLTVHATHDTIYIRKIAWKHRKSFHTTRFNEGEVWPHQLFCWNCRI